jgi:hypothetical protein
MVGQREPVALVADLLQQVFAARAVRQADRLRPIRTKDQFLLFGQTGQRQVGESRFPRGQHPCRELTSPPVDQEQVR